VLRRASQACKSADDHHDRDKHRNEKNVLRE
jgi:hypothetical protein